MDTRSTPRAVAARLGLAVSLSLAALGAGPVAAAAADASAPPTASPSVSPTAQPTPAPTAAPTPAPTPAPTAAPTAAPTPTPAPIVIRPAPSAVATPVITNVNLYRSSAMVRQYTDYWCVPAATQSMVNLVRRTSNRTYETQRFFYKQTRLHNRYTYRTLGNDPQGWAWAVRAYSGKPYTAFAYTSKSAALAKIVSSIARTGHPVGVTVRNGTHAWVVLGYRTSHMPSDPTRKSILGFYVSGPLGTASDQWPYRYLTVATFNQSFTRYHEWQRPVIWEGKWVVIGQ